MRFDDERVVVVGAGVSGAAAARVFSDEGADVRVTDERPRDELTAAAELEAIGVSVAADGHVEADLDGVSLVYLSPGVAPHARIVAWARDRSLPIWGELELGASLTDVPYIAVTGTNGKTTTAGMVEAMLRAGGLDVVACGNVGYPFPLAARERHQALVVEASSSQLFFQESFHPRISALLNIAPDHLDWHGTIEAYEQAKSRVFRLQRGDDTHVANRDESVAARVSGAARCRVVRFGAGEPSDGDVGYAGDRLVSRIGGSKSDLGPVDSERAGYRADAAAAVAAAISFGVSAEAAAAGLASFTPGRHRGEVVVVADGVRFVDNSKATNVHAALAAISAVSNAVLVAGGRTKGIDLSPLVGGAEHLRAVVALGESADEVAEVFSGRVPVSKASSIEDAARAAWELAVPGGVVLLAPACASWDQFRDYAERGERFARAAREIAEGDARRD